MKQQKKNWKIKKEQIKKSLRKSSETQEKAKKNSLTEKQRGKKYSINELALRGLNSFIEDPDFINTYNSDITKLFNTASEENKSAFMKELNRLENYGIIKKKAGFYH